VNSESASLITSHAGRQWLSDSSRGRTKKPPKLSGFLRPRVRGPMGQNENVMNHSIPNLAESDPPTQAILETLRWRAKDFGDEFEPKGSSVTVRCFNPDKHDNGDANPSASYHFGRYIFCRVCGYKKGQKAFANSLGIGEMQSGLTVAALAEQKHIPPEYLLDCGWGTQRSKGRAAVVIPWYDSQGPVKTAPAYHRRHYVYKGDAPGPRFTWDKPKHVKLQPYGSWRFHDWIDEAKIRQIPPQVWVVESELDAVTGWLHGVPAVAYGGTGFWRPEWVELFEPFDVIYVVAENDPAGQQAARGIALDLHTAFPEIDVKVVPFTEDAKDFNGLHPLVGGDSNSFQESLRPLIRAAVPADTLAEENALADAQVKREERERLFSVAGSLLEQPNLLNEAILAVENSGVVGERRAVGILHLAAKSRALKRPVNIEVNSPSSVGKTHTVLGVLALEPDSGVYELTAGSERALIYLDESLEHRTLYIQEPEGLQQGVGAAVIKSLVWEGRLRYDTVVKEDGGFVGKHIEKDGPTGLILTTTRPIDEQISNRMLRLELDSSNEQTRRILSSIAQGMNGAKPSIDVRLWHAVSLLVGEPAEVEISYGEWLAEHLATSTLRLRRDFTHLLTLIQASAVLYQFQRLRGPDGRIRANLADYAHVWELASDVFMAAQGEGVTDADRRMVEAIADLSTPDGGKVGEQGVSQPEVADRTGLTKKPVSYRVRRLLREGYLVNLNADKKGRSHRLVPGSPLPEEVPPLPPPGALAQHLTAAGLGFLVSPWVSPLTGKACDFPNFGDYPGETGETGKRPDINQEWNGQGNTGETPGTLPEPFPYRFPALSLGPQARAEHEHFPVSFVSPENQEFSEKAGQNTTPDPWENTDDDIGI